MCGRCFCTLDPEVLSRACNYKDSNGKFKQVPWHCPNEKNEYQPSPNIGPRDYLPIVTSGKHFGDKESRVLVPMMWGMVPNNWMDDPKKHKATTHNARIETVQQTMYREPLNRGNRCILVIEGIFEWKTTGSDKVRQPYCIYSSQKDEVKIEKPSSWSDKWSEDDGWQGLKVLKLAGLFKKTKNVITGDDNYSFTVITRESNNVLSWLHHRMPVFLTDPEDEEIWLNHIKFSKDEAMAKITKLSLTKDAITWHPVSTTVNNVRNKQIDLIMPVQSNSNEKDGKKEDQKKEKAKQFMSLWLKGKSGTAETKRKSDAAEEDLREPKKRAKHSP